MKEENVMNKQKFTTNLSLKCLKEYLPLLRYHYKVKNDNEAIELVIEEKVKVIMNELGLQKNK